MDPTPTSNSQTGGVEKSLFEIATKRLEIDLMHQWELIGTHDQAIEWTHPHPDIFQTEGSHIGDRRLGTLCWVVERHDHHCGDDLVGNVSCQRRCVSATQLFVWLNGDW